MKKSLSFILCILLLAACGQEPSPNKGSDDKPVNIDKSTNRINDASLTSSLVQKNKVENDYLFVYTVENETAKPIKLTFNSGQTFDYILKDQAGKTIIQYSEGKSFIQVITEKELVKGAQLTHDIHLKDLEPGEYTLEAWLTAKGVKDDSRKKIQFKVD
ncbi:MULTISPECIES: BsuPI-related putative proteinase inhibitor [Bacillaceae]|uniref:BsuPI-related putative proteinase inhibitor n=1 Tax=Bacillaceae TaxID=186817 RepID=UPI00080AF1BF|nr:MULTISPECIES: BsuPI-related putative proteinase inhibitor [Bacillaceae]OCA89478.1 hypothetical protein A8L44_00550 [Bacillus sp. FJAT-27986]